MRESIYKRNEKTIQIVPLFDMNTCNRCLSSKERHYLGRDNYDHCMDCEINGYLAYSTRLYRYNRFVEEREHRLILSFPLTQIQENASNFILKSIQNKRSCFLEAVCGAGKTEMTFNAILYALNKKMKICYAIPRKQVVIELASRFQKHFPDTIIKSLYDQSKDDEFAHLLLSTMNQLIHYYQEFDLMIVDEVDAFPFKDNPFLQRLVQKALKPNGIIIYMSATISKEYSILIKKNIIDHFQVYSRFHNHSLDLPQFEQVIHLEKTFSNKMIPTIIKQKLDEWQNLGKKVLLFVPSILFGIRMHHILLSYGYLTEIYHSKIKNKSYILNEFKKDKFLFLITTTILERGVTFSNINVAVVLSDHPIFTSNVLIQIAGRVGRNLMYPNGEIIFFSEFMSKAMTKAKSNLILMNKHKLSERIYVE
ncbi:MAG: DEAD/DEAH box helicase family protein [Firmicutes bacterium]|nr:DEAD/DEAH box helicase family protein [Bacillota bacterium]